MKIDPELESPKLVYSTMVRAINPRPIAWISTVSANGVPNLAPFSYFNGVCSKPATLLFSIVNKPDGSAKDTLRNIESNGQFVVNVVPYKLAEPMATTSSEFAYETSEFDAAGLLPEPAERVLPPRVAASPVCFECQSTQLIPIGEGPSGSTVVFGRILLIQINDRVLDEAGKIDPQKLDTIGRLGGRSYCRTTDRFEMK